MSNAAQAARNAALLLASHTRDEDLTDAQFAGALANSAYYYGIDVPSALVAFEALTTDEFLAAGPAVEAGAPWA